MPGRLQKKWKVNGTQLTLIICTFAIGGSLTGYAARKLMPLFGIGTTWLWILVYFLFIVLLWPLAVLLVSVPFGQFPFFLKYTRKIVRRIGIGRNWGLGIGNSEPPFTIHPPIAIGTLFTNIAIFASGAGSNAQKIIDYFRNHVSIKVSLIVCNTPGAGVLKIAEKEQIHSIIIEKNRFLQGDAYLDELNKAGIGFIILAGFLWKLPSVLLTAFPGKIINIHPALLPKYGGKGMYGHFVHEAVLSNKDKESGISIHYVDDLYDHGKLIFQARCPVFATDTADSLAQRVHILEHEHYSKVIEGIVKS